MDRVVSIFMAQAGPFKIFRIPPEMRKKPLTGFRYLRIFDSVAITEKHIPDREVRQVLSRIKGLAESQFNVFPFALTFQENEPEIEKIMSCIEQLFPNDDVVFIEVGLRLSNCTCEKCTRCGNCDICLTF